MGSDQIPQRLLDITTTPLPGAEVAGARLTRGQFHDVVLIDNVAAVRIARRPEAAAQPTRRTAVVTALGDLGLPFAVPAAITDVVTIDGSAAVATTWISGAAHAKNVGEPRRLAALLDALRSVPLAGLTPLLDEPHAYAGRERWLELMNAEVIPRLDASLRDEAHRRVDNAHHLPDVPPSLVHADLGGDNLRWAEDGRLLGVLDWDLAQASDPAIDAACLAWHGWDIIRAAVDAETHRRARIWYATFGIEQVGAAISNGEPEHVIARYVESASSWLQRTGTLS
jgi:aminoglycoside phosphotransferase (APT) family kinase protein